MKFCRKCGAGLDDNAQFCLECGEKSIDGFSQQDYSSVNLISNNGVLDAIRDCAKSTLFLVTLGIFVLSTVISFVFSMYEASRPSADSDTGVVAVILLIISLLIALGMGMVHSSARNGNVKTAGLTLIKVISIIMLIIISLALVVMIIAAGFYFTYMGNLENHFFSSDWGVLGAMGNSFYAALYTVAFVMAVAILAFFVVYYAFILRAITGITTTIQTGVVKGLGAVAFVGIASIIIGALAALGALGTIADGAVVVGLSTILSAASIILFGVLLINYRKRVIAYK